MLTLGVLGLAPASTGDDHTQPQVILRVGKHQQTGRIGGYAWSYRDEGGTCQQTVVDGITQFGDSFVKYKAPGTVRITFYKAQRPTGILISLWKHVYKIGYPRGRERHPGFELKPVYEDGTIIAWRAVFPARPKGDSYIEVGAGWEDEEGCGGEQGGSWYFELRARSKG